MVVLGIDPGSANCGYGVVARHGSRLVALDGGVIRARGLQEIHGGVGDLLDGYGCDALAVESLYFGVNVRTAFSVGHARGVVLLAAEQRGIPHRSYTPQQVKSAVCGQGRAEKGQVQRMVQALLSLDALPRPDHAADALAVAICDLNVAPMIAAVDAATTTRRGAPPPHPATTTRRGAAPPYAAAPRPEVPA